MNQRLNLLMIAIVCMLLSPLAALAQLPTPTYGWNLGNTLEPPSGEGTWGPAATQQLINAVADAGFNTIRLPVAWDSHANQQTYVIDAAWLARVKQVVDWCYARNLTVIVNCHWDGGWLDSRLDGTVDADVNAKMQSYWTQIANTFVNYDSRLLFAGANEPPADTAAEVAELMTYYQTFINAVRATGGNNATRWLVLSGPGTNIDLTDSLVNALPNDPTPNRLAMEVHFYPFQFTLMTQDESWGKMFYFWGANYHTSVSNLLERNSTWGEEAYVDEQFAKMQAKFTSKGIPVVVGEFCAVKRTGYPGLTGTELDRHLASRTFFNYYVVSTANSRGLKPVYWDAGGLGSNTAWLFDRSTAQVIDQPSITSLTGGPALPPPSSGGTAPAAPSALAVTAAFDTQISLSWADNASNENALEVQQATNASFTSNLITTTLAANATGTSLNLLTPSTTYYFRVRATNSTGASSYSNTASATTLPPAPGGSGSISQEIWTNVAGTAVSAIPVGTTPNQTGTLTSLEGPTNLADNYGQRVRGYLTAPFTGSYTFWIAGDDNCELWLSTSSDAAGKVRIAYHNDWTNSREWNKFATQKSAVINLVAGTNYYIEALQKEGSGGDSLAVGWAKPGQGTTAPSEVIPGIQLSPWDGGVPITPPSAPSALSAAALSPSQINLSWTDNAGNESGFEIDRATNSSFTANLVMNTVGANVTSYPATGLSASTTYYFRVRATNSAGDSANSNTASATTQVPDTTAPAAPTGLVAVPASSSAINLDWANNSESDLAGYNVYRSTTSGGPYTKVNGPLVTTSAFNDTGLAASTTYYYVVTAVDTSTNESGNSAQAWTTTQATAPAAPSNLTATSISTSQINLAWTDNSSDETGFKVDRAANSSFTSGLVTSTVGANVTSFQATGLTRNTMYYFRVRAYNATGDSANSNTANVKTKVK